MVAILDGIKAFCKKHKIITVIIVLIIICCINSFIGKIKKKAEEDAINSHEYSLAVDNERFEFDCNSSSGQYCQERIITGSFSEYDETDIYIDLFTPHECASNNGKFECKTGTESLSNWDDIENISSKMIPDSIEKTYTISIRRKSYPSSNAIMSKTVTVLYRLSSDDKDRIVAYVQNYNAKKAAEKQAAEEAKNNEDNVTDNNDTQKTTEEPAEKSAEESNNSSASSRSDGSGIDPWTISSDQLYSAVDICTEALYESTRYSMVPNAKYYKTGGSAGEEYVFNLSYADENVWFSCRYNTKDKTATVNDWEYR